MGLFPEADEADIREAAGIGRESVKMKQKNRLLRIMPAVLACLALLFFILPAQGEERTDLPLDLGSKGDTVLAVKRRLYELRYYRTDELSRNYTEDTAEKIRDFQHDNGLPETGAVDEITMTILMSDQAQKKPYPTMPPLAAQEPKTEPDWPERDGEGFLAGDGEYFYENDEEGLWIYLNRDLQIMITFCEDRSLPLEWFETEIIVRNGEAFRTVMTNPERPGRTFQYPYVIAREEKFVLAFSDDFYGNRMGKKSEEKTGLIIREGRVVSEETNKKTGHHLPNLDIMAQFPDGSLRVYECNEKTAQELLEAGAVNVFSFGPILIRNGEINELVYQYYKSIEPRHALGMIEPNHYFLLSVQGRRKDSDGTNLQRVAEIMKERGVTEALNLDGGNTMALVFRGRMLNKLATYKKKNFVRTVTSLIGIGRTDNTETD